MANDPRNERNVFLSHSSLDEELTDLVAAGLVRFGIRVAEVVKSFETPDGIVY